MAFFAALKERVAPKKRSYRLFEDVGRPHEITVSIYTHPFRHIIIDNFLPQKEYAALEADFTGVLAKGISPEHARDAFSRFDLYDLFSYTPKPTLELPYGCFFSESYFQMLESALSREFTRDTFATFHHHRPNPQDNYIHNDFVYEYFAHDPLANGMNAWYYQCNKHAPSAKGSPKVRAATSIFYLANEVWSDGDGGETGIFSTRDKASFVRAVPPINNRLLAFDITPTSFHNYRACRMDSRNSFAQWFFVDEEEVRDRFPGAKPGGWEHLHKLEKAKAAPPGQ